MDAAGGHAKLSSDDAFMDMSDMAAAAARFRSTMDDMQGSSAADALARDEVEEDPMEDLMREQYQALHGAGAIAADASAAASLSSPTVVAVEEWQSDAITSSSYHDSSSSLRGSLLEVSARSLYCTRDDDDDVFASVYCFDENDNENEHHGGDDDVDLYASSH